MQAYEVRPYSLDELRHLLAAKAPADLHTVDGKRHLVYFRDYFSTIGAKTIIVENDYIDRDYLDDFAGYYVRCFHDYAHRCTRLHFFSCSFDEHAFSAMLAGEAVSLSPDQLQGAYLGFIVVKPLPRTFIGRTCLRTYPPEGRRHFPITRTYEANLFGLRLCVESLAFQEQDTVAAACATSALWSAFHGTGKQFQHPIPSPVEITRAATAQVRLDTRTFPNSSGLWPIQMADGIRSVGLEPYAVNATDEFVLRSNLYAYLRGQIPILLILTLPAGRHAVTVTGYSLGKTTPVAYQQSTFLLRAFRIDKVYAHDDQVGPFARMELMPGGQLTTSWLGPSGSGTLQAQPETMLIPLYPKIRLPFLTILGIVFSFDSLINGLRLHIPLVLPTAIEWDIYLTNVNTLKSELQTLVGLTGEYRRQVLTAPMPRFIWRATALLDDVPALDLLFDATDIEQGPSFVGVIEYNAVLGQILRSVSQTLQSSPQALDRPDRHVLSWLAQSSF